MSSGRKAYGRSVGSGTVVESVFGKQPSSDPYVFESDEDGGSPVKSAQPAKKKSKVNEPEVR